MKHLVILVSILFAISSFGMASEKNDHAHSKAEPAEQAEHEDHKEHEEQAEHKENKEHDEHDEEERSQVGPDKGILEASEDKGIKLSPEAEKNFEIEKIAFHAGQITLNLTAFVTAGVEINVFRFRDGFYKRIDFIKLSQTNNQITIASKDLVKGDYIVTRGLGFLRIAEIAAFGGAPEGHSH